MKERLQTMTERPLVCKRKSSYNCLYKNGLEKGRLQHSTHFAYFLLISPNYACSASRNTSRCSHRSSAYPCVQAPHRPQTASGAGIYRPLSAFQEDNCISPECPDALPAVLPHHGFPIPFPPTMKDGRNGRGPHDVPPNRYMTDAAWRYASILPVQASASSYPHESS